MAFGRWDPIRDLLAIQQRLERFAPGPAGWMPAVDLHETADHYVLTAEVPGLRREDVQIQFQDQRLTVSGTRQPSEASCEQYHCVERGHGSFTRTFELPVHVDAEQIVADLHDGVLTITCPKTGPDMRRIRIG